MFELDHWKVETKFSADEIGALYVGHDPREIGGSVKYRTIEPIKRRIEADYLRACHAVEIICIHKQDRHEIIEALSDLKNRSSMGLFSIELLNQVDNLDFFLDTKDVIDWVNSGSSRIDNQQFSIEEIRKWLKDEKLVSKFSFSDSSEVIQEPAHAKTTWPWGNHTSKRLQILAEAGIKYWALYDPSDPSTAPLSSDVVDWLRKTHNVSKAQAKYMASILRADGLPSGRRPTGES